MKHLISGNELHARNFIRYLTSGHKTLYINDFYSWTVMFLFFYFGLYVAHEEKTRSGFKLVSLK